MMACNGSGCLDSFGGGAAAAVSERLRSPKELIDRISRRLPAPRPCFPFPPAARVALVVSFVLFFQVSSAFAVPIAEWGGPWQVTLGIDLTTIGDDEQAKRAFGKDAQKDGEIKNVGSFFEPLGGDSPPALAKADGEVGSGICVFSCNRFFANTTIEFDRAFRLEGSPSGQWSVDLVTALAGQIQAGGDGNPEAIVGASVTIATLSDPTTILLSISFDYDVTHDNLIIRDTVSRLGFFNDGTYLVDGVLIVDTAVSEERTSLGGFAQANFFNSGPDFGGVGLGATLGAAPLPAQVPEPATIVLLGIGVFALGGALWRRNKKAC